MSQINDIFQGFKNLIFKDEKIEPIAETRLAICYPCPARTDNKCDRSKGGCGCFLKAKVRSLSSSCPKQKW